MIWQKGGLSSVTDGTVLFQFTRIKASHHDNLSLMPYICSIRKKKIHCNWRMKEKKWVQLNETTSGFCTNEELHNLPIHWRILSWEQKLKFCTQNENHSILESCRTQNKKWSQKGEKRCLQKDQNLECLIPAYPGQKFRKIRYHF